MRRQLVLLLAAVVVGGVAVGTAGAGTVQPRTEKSTTTNLDNNAKSFDIANTRGSVSITSGSKASVVSQATYTLTQPKIVVTTTNGVVKVTVDCNGLLGAVTNALLPNDCRTNLIVTLPAAATVHATTDAAPLTVNNMAGVLNLFSQSGPLSLTKSSGKSMGIATGSGQLVIDQVSTPSLTARSNSGAVIVKKAFAQNFTSASSSSTIRVENSSLGATTVQSDSGALSFTAITMSTASFTTGAGSITLHQILAQGLNAGSQTGKVDVIMNNAAPNLTLSTKSSAINASVPKGIYKLTTTTKGSKPKVTKIVPSPNASHEITVTTDTGAITITGR